MERRSDKPAVAVLGAGPMGLGVAYQLARDGRRVVVFEADDRIGGMAASFDFGGIDIERYYHFHAVSDHAFFEVLRELGLEDRLRWVETRMGYFYRNRVQRWGNPLALLRFRGLGWIAKFRYGLHALLATRRDHWRDLDRIEATGWIRRWIGEEAWEVLWRRLFDYKFYEHAQDLSAAWIWSRIRRIGRSRYSLMREKLGYLEGGSAALLEAMRAEIERRGGELRLGQPVQRVLIEAGRVRGVLTAAGEQRFEQVISTVPLAHAPRLMPDLPAEILDAWRAIPNVAVVCVIVKLAKPVSDNFWLNVNDPAMDIPGIVEYTNLRPLDAHVVYVPFYMPGTHPKYAEPDAAYETKVVGYLRRINPALSAEDVLEVRVNRYRHAQPVCGPGFLDRLPPIRTPVEGLLVADTCHYYPEDRGISESIGLARRMARML
ncbi:NAD(P)/FAD-dependent oxidoreductase [Burkholderia stagnalis]|uniref:NAD(P)/FAD-dependent oxidoreductase n=1 Tax=Burkholderia stagnalis TaxID=1503054 RepID=UPI0009C038A9|nr:NAD(P)/FAD-dependent oxidoreductase [Burkholderia stagnalis]